MQEMQETQVWLLGWEDPPKKEMATCSSILAWKIPRTEEPVRQAIVNGVAKSQTPLSTHVHAHIHTHVCVHILYTHTHYFMSLIRLINGNFSPTNWGHNTNHICLPKKDTGRYSLQWGVGGVCGCVCWWVCVCLEKRKKQGEKRVDG